MILTNKTLTIVTEPVYHPGLLLPGRHKRRYAPADPRNSNLNFDGSRLGVGYAIDCWTFASLPDMEDFCDWYARQPRTP